MKEKEEFDTLTEKSANFNKAKDGLTRLNADISMKRNEVLELENKLNAAKKTTTDIEKRIEDGKKYLEQNKTVVKDYEAANEAWLNLSKTLAEYDKWKGVLKKEKEYNELLEVSLAADGTLDKLRKELLKLTKSYLPDIEGLEIKVKTSLDDEDEGIYYQGKTLAQLSESELWTLFTQIWQMKDVQFVFCENINSLGSDAITILNKLVKGGAMVFATEMQREKDHMEISLEIKLS